MIELRDREISLLTKFFLLVYFISSLLLVNFLGLQNTKKRERIIEGEEGGYRKYERFSFFNSICSYLVDEGDVAYKLTNV